MFFDLYKVNKFFSKGSPWYKLSTTFNLAITLGILFIFSNLTACSKQLSSENLAAIEDAVENKIATASKVYESGGIEAVTRYCENEERISTQIGIICINCTVAANFYNPNDKIITEGNNVIFPVSLYSNAENALHLLDKGWNFREMTISAFARSEESYFDPLITRSKDFK